MQSSEKLRSNIIINIYFTQEFLVDHLISKLQDKLIRMIAVQSITQGAVYRIRNRKTNAYLTSLPQICTTVLHQGKVSQLWLLDQVKPSAYEIVSLQTGKVLARKQTLVIQKGNWSTHQFWKLQRAQMNINQNFFWIMAFEDETQHLFGTSTSNKVSMKSIDATLFVSNWQIIEADVQKDLRGCCVFKSEYSNMVIDVPQGSNKQGINIIQYHPNGRGNQRWVLQRVIDQFVIRNLCSNMILSPNTKSVKEGVKIIQSQFTNKAHQKWILEKYDQRKYLIKNKADSTLYLGVGSTKESANIQLVKEKQKGIWVLQGSVSVLQPIKN